MTSQPLSPRTCKDCRHEIKWVTKKSRQSKASYKHINEQNGKCKCGCTQARPFTP